MQIAELVPSKALGALLAHTVRVGKHVLKKGHRLSASDVEALVKGGHHTVTVARLEDGDIAENAAARRVAVACAGNHVRVGAPFAGRANLYATESGVALIDVRGIATLNGIDESITVATLPAHARVARRQMLATVKIIPFAAPGAAVEAIERLARHDPAIRVAPFAAKSLALISTKFPDTKDALLDKSRTVLDARLGALGSRIFLETRVVHRSEAVATALQDALTAGADPILIFGASAITDRRDVVPAGILQAGGTVTHFGMPVDPGNLLLLGRLNGAVVIGLPGCARSPKRNGFDFVLERVLADIPITGGDIAAMGVGGLLTEIASRPQPRDVRAAPTLHAPAIAAIVLAAGMSSRMGSNKLLADIHGEPLVRQVVAAAASSHADPVVVVTGNDSDKIAAALSDLPILITNNADFRSGLSTSLRTGVTALPQSCDGAMIMLGDMPAISPLLIDRMIAAFDPGEDRAICVATHDGKRGNPVLWSRRFFPDLLNAKGDAGAKHLIEENEELVCEVEADNDGPLMDIDAPEELAAWLARSK